MNGSLRRSMAQLHTWAGLLAGWILFIVFATGTAAYFNGPISQWMQPEIPWARPTLHSETKARAAAEHAVAWLHANAPSKASGWLISLPGDHTSASRVRWNGGQHVTLDTSGVEIHPRDTLGGGFFAHFHYNLYYISHFWARWIVGCCAMAMLIAIISGVITHKKIFADFFTLRLGKGRRSWLDAHTAAGVLTLPFMLMITYTGLIVSMHIYVPPVARLIPPQLAQTVQSPKGSAPTIAAESKPAPLMPIGPVVDRAVALWNGYQPSLILISNPGKSTATIEIRPSTQGRIITRGAVQFDNQALVFDGVSGALQTTIPRAKPEIIHSIEGAMFGLHRGDFAAPVLRWLYLLSGFAGTFLIAAGLVLWTVKRRERLSDPQQPHFGFRVVEALNTATIVGFSAGIAAYFLSNRLLPPDMGTRAAWEANSLFIAWGGFTLWTLIRPPRRAWIETLASAGALYAAVPLVNALTTDRGLVRSLLREDWVFVGFDSTMLVVATLFALAAWKVATHRSHVIRRRMTPQAAKVAA